MTNQDTKQRWEHLSRLLEPIHGRAVATARNLCRSSGDGDDLYQEAVLRAFDKLHTLREEARFRSWFFAVLISVHRSRHRRSFWKRFLPLDDMNDAPSLAGEDGRVREEEYLAARRAAKALSRLPAVQREAVVLYELEGFSMEEVAALQDATVPAVKARVFRGRQKLRRIYERMEGVRPAPEDPERSLDDDSSERRSSKAGSGLLFQIEPKISTGRRS